MGILTQTTPTVVVLEQGRPLPPGVMAHPASAPGAIYVQQMQPAARARLHPIVALGGAALVAAAASAAGVWVWMKQAEPAVVVPAQVMAACRQCGRVESVNVSEVRGQATGIGAVGGGIAGAVVGNQFGKGNGKKALTAAGLLGGALAGHEAEKAARIERTWTVAVRMENGLRQSFSQGWEPGWRIGDRVRVVDGRVVPR